jgi:hypothetical protein
MTSTACAATSITTLAADMHAAGVPLLHLPCGASLGRAPGTGFPLRWVSYGAKRREIS